MASDQPARPADSCGAAEPERLGWRSSLALFALAAVLRLAHVLSMAVSPYFANPVIDAAEYADLGWRIARGLGHPDAVFWHPPGYPYFLGAIWAGLGGSYMAPRLVQVMLGAASVVLTAWLGTRLVGRRAGLAAGLGAALYGMLIYFDGELLAPTLMVFLMLASVALALAARERRLLWLACGVLGGLGALVVATTAVVPLVLAVWARRRAGWVVLGLALAIAPATLHNLVRGGEPVLISANGGVNLWIGNNPHYDQTVGIRPDGQWRRLVNEPAAAGVHGRAAASAYFVNKTLAWARHEPRAFLALQARKLGLLLAGNEIYRNHAIYPARQDSPVLAALLWKVPGLAFPFGLLMPLAMVGLLVGARRQRLLAALVTALAALTVAFFITARYRVALVPFLLIFAAYAVTWFVRQASTRARVLAGGLGLGLFLFANLGQGAMETRMNADAEYSLAMRLGERGRLREAMALFESAVASRPDYEEAWLNLAVCYDQLGRPADAQTAVNTAFEIDRAVTVESVRRFAADGKPELARRLVGYLDQAMAAAGR